jgi:hypothetical protein
MSDGANADLAAYITAWFIKEGSPVPTASRYARDMIELARKIEEDTSAPMHAREVARATLFGYVLGVTARAGRRPTHMRRRRRGR